MIDATHLKTHRTASSPRGNNVLGPLHRPHQGRPGFGASCNYRHEKPPGQPIPDGGPDIRPYRRQGLAASIPSGQALLADRGYDTGWFRKALIELGIILCIPSRKARKIAVQYNEALYHHRHRIENMFGRLKDGRRIATCYDRCADIVLSACALAAVILFWLGVLSLE